MNIKKLVVASLPLMTVSLMGIPSFAHEGKMTTADTDLARRIRQDLAADSNLSAYAQNIKIIALNGKVILKGKVDSDSERQTLVNKVSSERGVDSVVNKLGLKTDTMAPSADQESDHQ